MKIVVSMCALALVLAACQPSATTVPSPGGSVVAGRTSAPAPAQQPASPASRPAKPAVPVVGPIHAQWQCGELLVNTDTSRREIVKLAFSGRKLTLRTTGSTAGKTYADAAGNELRLGPGGSTLVLAGQAPRQCTGNARPSPWNEAASRGIGFRAVGGEPGWFVEVGRGDAPSLRATLDYGERQVDIDQMLILDGQSGWTGHAADGAQVTLQVERKPCQDGMSGETFESSARLSVGDKVYEGCGAHLFD